MKRRDLLRGGTAIGALIVCGLGAQVARSQNNGSGETFEINLTEAEWKQKLTPEEFEILRNQGTETPFTSPLLDEHRDGTFTCAGCELPLFSSATKFESHTGWPSFYQPLDNAVRTRVDNSAFLPRTEVHCRRCGGHLGHVFDDGPPPTGKRYCMDGIALHFVPGKAA